MSTRLKRGSSITLPLFLFAVSVLFVSSISGYKYGTECGVLYSGSGLSGQNFTLMDFDQSSNLVEDYRTSQSGWNSTRSFLVHPGCKLDVWNETHFDGNGRTFQPGRYATELDDIKTASVKCNCPKVCSCSNVEMRWIRCAYVGEGGCDACNAVYTDFRGEDPDIAGEFPTSITAFRLREGCTLKLYDDVDFDGEQTTIEATIFKNFNGTVKSHRCTCESRPPPPPPTRKPNVKYPEPLNIPLNLEQLGELLRQFPDHPGFLSALNSVNSNPERRRSPRNAYILLLGTSGSGKSSAINILFDHANLTRVGGRKSTTTDIHELRIPLPMDDLGISNSELRVIDTPGFGDTRGLEQDAKFFATLDDFLATHEELKNRVPNVVLIFHKFHDNRFEGDGAKFVQMLAGLTSFRDRVMDNNYSNVIFVLSHFCSETKGIQRRPNAKLAEFKKVIESYSVLPRPTIITVAENMAASQHLPMANGYWRLPNGDYYPRNLFDKIEMVTTNTGDDVGKAVFRTAFRYSDNFNVTHKDFLLVRDKSPKVIHYLNIITRIVVDIKNTEVSLLLQEAEEGMSPDLRSRFPHALHYLQKMFNVMGVHNKAQIPKTSAAVLELLSDLEQSEATLYLIHKGLNIRAPVFPQSVVAGQAYNVFIDGPVESPPIFSSGGLHPSDIGYMVPDIISCRKVLKNAKVFQLLPDKEKYVRERLHHLGVTIDGALPLDQFEGQVKPGYNLRTRSSGPEGSELSATREVRLFKMELGDKIPLTQEFNQTVLDLGQFDPSNATSVSRWRKFFDQYGTHVVKSAYGGGAVEVTVTSNETLGAEVTRALFDLLQFGEDLSFMRNGSSSKDFLKRVDHSLKSQVSRQ